MIIEYWSDFACPFCYIAETRMKKALRELDISDECRLDFKAFELNQDAPKIPKRNIVEGFSHHYGMTMEQAQAQVDRICAMGKEEGLEFNYATARGSNTFDALRLTKLAQSKGRELGDAFVERMYKAYFTENRILADRETLLSIAEEMGLDRKESEDLLDGDMYSKEVRRDEQKAYYLGISAVPFFVINKKYGIPGAVETSQMKKVLMKAYSEEETEELQPGMTCGPDGCGPAGKD